MPLHRACSLCLILLCLQPSVFPALAGHTTSTSTRAAISQPTQQPMMDVWDDVVDVADANAESAPFHAAFHASSSASSHSNSESKSESESESESGPSSSLAWAQHPGSPFRPANALNAGGGAAHRGAQAGTAMGSLRLGSSRDAVSHPDTGTAYNSAGAGDPAPYHHHQQHYPLRKRFSGQLGANGGDHDGAGRDSEDHEAQDPAQREAPWVPLCSQEQSDAAAAVLATPPSGYYSIPWAPIDTRKPPMPPDEPLPSGRRKLLVGPQSVGIGLYVLNLAAVDTSAGSFTIDFFLFFKSTQLYEGYCGPKVTSCAPQESIDRILLNMGRLSTIQSIDKFIAYNERPSNWTTQYRVKGIFSYDSDLSRWPFETQLLQIKIEDPHRDADSLTFYPISELTLIAPQATAPGWNLDMRLVPQVQIIGYPGGRNFSRYSVAMPLKRPLGNTIIKTILPPMFILCVQIYSFAIAPDNVESRISIAGTGLTAAVMLHVQFASATPPTSYLLFGDKIMTMVYLVIVFNGVMSVAMLKYRRIRGNSRRAMHVYRLAETILIFLLPAAGGVLVLEWYDASIGLSVILLLSAVLLAIACRWYLDRRTSSARGRQSSLKSTQSYAYTRMADPKPGSPFEEQFSGPIPLGSRPVFDGRDQVRRAGESRGAGGGGGGGGDGDGMGGQAAVAGGFAGTHSVQMVRLSSSSTSLQASKQAGQVVGAGPGPVPLAGPGVEPPASSSQTVTNDLFEDM